MIDKDIIQLYLNRDQRALSVTAKKYGKYCTSIAKNILGNNEDAEECVNDTYLSTWNSIPPTIPTILSAFLGKITRNLAFNKYKHNHVMKRGNGEIAVVLDELAECVSGVDDVEQEIDRRELVATILFWKPCHQKRETYSSVDIGILTAFHQLQGGMK